MEVPSVEGPTSPASSATYSPALFDMVLKSTEQKLEELGSIRQLVLEKIQTFPSGPPAAVRRHTSALAWLLDDWNDALEALQKKGRNSKVGPEFLIYILSKDYPDADLFLDVLRGKDAHEAMVLKNACIDADFHLLLARFHRKVTAMTASENPDGIYPHECWMDDVWDSECHLEGLEPVFVRATVKDHPDVSEADLLDPQCFEGLEYDDAEYEGVGEVCTEWYCRTALVILPPKYVYKYLFVDNDSGDEDEEESFTNAEDEEEEIEEEENGVNGEEQEDGNEEDEEEEEEEEEQEAEQKQMDKQTQATAPERIGLHPESTTGGKRKAEDEVVGERAKVRATNSGKLQAYECSSL